MNMLGGPSGPPTAPVGAPSESNFAGVSKQPMDLNPPTAAPAPRPPDPRPRRRNDSGGPQIAAATPICIQRALQEVGNPTIVEKSEEKQLREFQASFDRLRQFSLDHTSDKAHEAYCAQRRHATATLASGDLETATAQDFWTEAEFKSDFQGKREAAWREQKNLSATAHPIVCAIVDRMIEAAEKAAEAIEKQERVCALEWGVGFQPSLRLLTVSQIPQHIQRWRPVKDTTFAPAEILRTLGKLQ
jgi:hypothetical protein